MLKKTILLALAVMVPLLATANSEFMTTRTAHPSPGGDAIMLPSPVEDHEVTRARLEAEGLWDGDRTPPENPQVGDTWLWYTWHFMGGPSSTLDSCTVRGLGDHVYVVVEDSQWDVSIDQADVDIIVEHFDNISIGNYPDQGIWDLNTSHFGDPPDFDGLERIFLLYYEFEVSADGFFWAFDQYPDGTYEYESNEADVLYLATDSGGGPPASNYMLAVAAHEFQHLIHWNQDDNEETWLDEGMAELAMWLFGSPDFISSFNTQPDNSLIDWGDGTWADYIQCYLWTLYIYEQFGGQEMIWDVVHHALNGMASYQSVLSALGYSDTMEDIFGRWSVANFLDDTTLYSGEYGYIGDELPPFYPWRTVSSYPYSTSGMVQDWASEYIRLLNFEGAPRFNFNGSDTHDFRVKMMALDPLLPTLVTEISLDEFQDAEFTFCNAFDYEEAIVSVASVTTIGAGSYSFTVDNLATDTPVIAPLASSLSAFPNPFNPATELSLCLERAGRVELSIFDLSGRQVDRLISGTMEAGEHRISWKPQDLPSGVYMARLTQDNEFLSTEKLLMLK